MKRTGFTLVELLAVITILAIIFLIAFPIVTNIINDAKESSLKKSVQFYLDAVEKNIASHQVDDPDYEPNRCDVQSNGNVICYKNEEVLKVTDTSNELEIKVKGEKPTSGTLTIEDGKVTNIQNFLLKEKYFLFDEKGKVILVNKKSLAPGLYDSNENLLASWDELVSTYGLNIEDNYGSNNLNNIPALQEGSGSMYSVVYYNDIFEDVRVLVLPKTVTSIGMGAIQGIDKFERIEVEDGNPVYEDRGSNAIIEKSTNTLVAGYKNTVIPNNITSIGACAFTFINITRISIPSSVTSIDVGAFFRCNSLASVTFESNSQLVSIGSLSFAYCGNLENITIPNSVTNIEALSFAWCDSLTSITIPASVTNIEFGAFGGCTNLTSVVFENTEGWYCDYEDLSEFSSVDVTDPSINASNLKDYVEFIREQ